MTGAPQEHVVEILPELRVLLFSPVHGVDPASGDTSYTEALLDAPPAGVRYTTYIEAQRNGTVTVLGRKPWRNGSWSLTNLLLLLLRTAEAASRQSGLMFREPTWFVELRPGSYDLIHQHLFPVRQVGPRIPVMSSAGYPLTVLYREREGWSRRRTGLAECLENWWCRMLRVHNPWLHQVSPSIMSVYSAAAEAYLHHRGASGGSTRIISTGIPEFAACPRSSTGRALLFVGRDFHLKGGDLVLAAFARLRRLYPDLTLTIVTATDAVAATGEHARPDGVEWFTDLDRATLLAEVYPRCDVLVAPTRSDCGAPYAVLEALQGGLAVVLSDLQWLDPRLAPPAVYRVSHNPDELCETLRRLLDPEVLGEAQRASRMLWIEHFGTETWGASLRQAYADSFTLGAEP